MSEELLKETHEQTIKNGQLLEEVVNRLDTQREELEEEKKRIQWNRDKLKSFSGMQNLGGYLVGGAGTIIGLIAMLIQAGVV